MDPRRRSAVWSGGPLPTVAEWDWRLEAGLVTVSGGSAYERLHGGRVECLMPPARTMGLASLSENGTNNDYRRSEKEPPVPPVRHETMLNNKSALCHPSPGCFEFSRTRSAGARRNTTLLGVSPQVKLPGVVR